MGTESDIDQSLTARKRKEEKGAVSGFEFEFVYLQTQYVKEFSHVVLQTACAASLSNVLHRFFVFFLSFFLLTLFPPAGHGYQIGSGEN